MPVASYLGVSAAKVAGKEPGLPCPGSKDLGGNRLVSKGGVGYRGRAAPGSFRAR